MKSSKLKMVQNMLIYFFVCSFIGWILEVIYAYFVLGTYVNRGFVFGPICPIYGCGAIIMALIGELIKKKQIKTIILKFVIITVLFSTLEYFTSLFMEMLFGLRWWDYTLEFCNLNGRICLGFSLTFGILGIIFIEYIYEPTKKLINKLKEKISSKALWIIIVILSSLFIIDEVFSIIKYLK